MAGWGLCAARGIAPAPRHADLPLGPRSDQLQGIPRQPRQALCDPAALPGLPSPAHAPGLAPTLERVRRVRQAQAIHRGEECNISQGMPPKKVANATYGGTDSDKALGKELLEQLKSQVGRAHIHEPTSSPPYVRSSFRCGALGSPRRHGNSINNTRRRTRRGLRSTPKSASFPSASRPTVSWTMRRTQRQSIPSTLWR